MATSIVSPGTEQRAAWVASPERAALPATVRAYFGRLREWFGSVPNTAWAMSQQPEHLFAYATWDETLAEREQ